MVVEGPTTSEPLTDEKLDAFDDFEAMALRSHDDMELIIHRLVEGIRELRDKLDRVTNVKSIKALLADNARLRAALDELINCPALADARALLAQKKAEPAEVS